MYFMNSNKFLCRTFINVMFHVLMAFTNQTINMFYSCKKFIKIAALEYRASSPFGSHFSIA